MSTMRHPQLSTMNGGGDDDDDDDEFMILWVVKNQNRAKANLPARKITAKRFSVPYSVKWFSEGWYICVRKIVVHGSTEEALFYRVLLKKRVNLCGGFFFFSCILKYFFVMLHKNITSFYIEEHSALDRKSRSWNNMIVVMPSGIYYSTAAQSKFYVSEMEKADRHSF